MNITKKLAIASIGTAVLIGVVVPQVSAGRQQHDGYYCDPLVTNGRHWGWECTGTVPTPQPTPVVTSTPAPTSTVAPTPEATPEPTATPSVPIDTPVPDPTHNGAGVAGCWVDGCPPRGDLVRPEPEVFLVPPAVFTPTPVATATPVEVPAFIPLPPKAGMGTGTEGWDFDTPSYLLGVVAMLICSLLGRFVGNLIDRRRLD